MITQPLLEAIPSGDTNSDQLASHIHMSMSMSMSMSKLSLQRYLQNEVTNFQQVMDGTRVFRA